MSNTQRIKVSDIPTADFEVIKAIAKNGCRAGDTLSDLAYYTGFSSQKLAAVARKYDGSRIGRVVISYLPPQDGTMVKAAPGIKNPKTGICARIPAEISVTIYKRRAAK
jgi:hypothetical protein